MTCEACGHANPPQALSCEQCQEKLYHAKLRVDGQTYFLFPGKYRIGRCPDNEIVIEDDSVSRFHCEIEFQNGAFIVRDLGSKNGSLLNDGHFTVRRLHDLDCLQLGNVVLHFYDERNKQRQPARGLDTAEWVEREFFKYTQSETGITTDDLLLTMLDLTISLVHAEEALVLQFDADKRLRFKIGKQHRGQRLFENQLSEFDWNIINNAIRTRSTELVYREIPSDPDETVEGKPYWHKLAIPLTVTNIEERQKSDFGVQGVVGVLFLSQPRRTKEISDRKWELLNTLVQQITFAIENEMLYEQALEKHRIDRELSLAKEVQQKLLPVSNPNAERFEVASFVHPCETVSGDYLDFFPISSNRVGMAVGDICGKGVPAALLTSTVQAAIHSQLEYTRSAEQIVSNLNRLLMRNTAESIFLTLFFGILDLDAGEFRYINAGHPPPIFISRDQQILELGGTAPALGIFETKFNCERTVKFEPGDTLLMYTDGIIESQNARKTIYGRKRLLKLVESLFLENANPVALEEVIGAITNDLIDFIAGAKQNDDLTLLAVKRR